MSSTSVSNAGDRFARLAAQVEYPEAWKPEPGDTLVGEAVRWETVTPREGENACEVLTLRDPSGKEWSVWTWHTILRNELVGKVKPANLVALHFLGKRARQDGGGEYAAYRVAIEASDKDAPPDDDVIPY